MRYFYNIYTKKNEKHLNDNFNFYPKKRKKLDLSKKKSIILNTVLLFPYFLLNFILYFIIYFLTYINNINENELFPNYFINIGLFLLLSLMTIFQIIYINISNKILLVNLNKTIYYILKYFNLIFLLISIIINYYFLYNIFK